MVTMEPIATDLAPILARLQAKGLDTTPDPADDPHRESPEDARERMAAQAANRAARWATQVPVAYAKAALADLDPGPYAGIQRWITTREALTLVLAGPVGTGKTWAAYAIGNHMAARGVWVEGWNVHDLLEAMRPGGDASAYERACTARLVVLDDLGATRPTDWARSQLLGIVNARVSDRLRTIVTTNASDVILREAWEPRMVDRLAENGMAVTFSGPSRRRAAW
jgi:DNA replication protein